MLTSETIIAQTKKWIIDVVAGCNFCPFASREVKKGSVHYEVLEKATSKSSLETLAKMFLQLDEDPGVETSLLILPGSFSTFETYLQLVDIAERFLKDEGYEGIYQLASFHPLYLFAGTTEKDAANYTNRSVYPMLHLLREESIDKALENYNKPEDIPDRNINFAREKGLVYMKMLRDSCLG